MSGIGVLVCRFLSRFLRGKKPGVPSTPEVEERRARKVIPSVILSLTTRRGRAHLAELASSTTVSLANQTTRYRRETERIAHLGSDPFKTICGVTFYFEFRKTEMVLRGHCLRLV